MMLKRLFIILATAASLQGSKSDSESKRSSTSQEVLSAQTQEIKSSNRRRAPSPEFPKTIRVEISYNEDGVITTGKPMIRLKLGDPGKFFEIQKEIDAQIALVLPSIMESKLGGSTKLHLPSFPDYGLYLWCNKYITGQNLFIFDIHSCIEEGLAEEVKERETNPTEGFKRDFNRMLREYAETNPSFEIPEDWFYRDTIQES